MQRLDLTGRQFGYWTVLEYIYPGRWRCRCICGKEVLVIADTLLRGRSKSCGCRKAEMIGDAKRRHGLSYSKVHQAWSGMKRRCLNPQRSDYPLYGGRGITVCERWLNSFENFLADMGEPPGPEYSLERIDSDGNYEPSNCRWATDRDQRINQRRMEQFTYEGETHCLKDWARIKGIPYPRLHQRIRKLKWPFERAIEATEES